MTVILCTKCGTRNEETASFCGGCGAFLEFYGQKVAADGTPNESAPAPAAAVSPSPAAAVSPSPAPAAHIAEPASGAAAEVPPTPVITAPGPTPSLSVGTAGTVPGAGTEAAPGGTPVVEAAVPTRPPSVEVLAEAPKANGHSAEMVTPEPALAATMPVEMPLVEPLSAGTVAPEVQGPAVPAPAVRAAEPAATAEAKEPVTEVWAPEAQAPVIEAAALEAQGAAAAPETETPGPQGPAADVLPAAETPGPQGPATDVLTAAEAPAADAFSAVEVRAGDVLSAARVVEALDVVDEPEASPQVPPAPRPRRGGPSRRFAVTTGPAETPTSMPGAVPPDTSAAVPATPSMPVAPPMPAAITPAAIAPAAVAPTPPPPVQPVARHPAPLDQRSDAAATPVEGPPARLPVAAPEKPAAPPDQPAARLPTEELRRTPPRPTTPQPEARVARPGDLICGNCGAPNDPSRHFCASCGRSLAAATSLPAAADPWWRRLLRRVFGRRQAAPMQAGERTAQLQSGDRGGGSRVLAGIRTMVLTIVATLIGFAIVGYLAVPSIHNSADDLIHQVTSAFATPVHVYPDTVTGRALPGHGPQFAVDKTHNLFWAAPLGAQPPSLDFRFNAAIDLTAIIVTPGAETDINGYARPKLIRLTLGDAPPIEKTLEDAQLVDASGGGGGKVLAFQVLDLPASKVNEVKLDVLSVYPGKRDAVAIGEVEFVARP